MVVDDEPYIVHCVAEMISAHTYEEAAFEVYTAYSAQEALKRFEHIRIDVLICDIEMPEMTGLELTREIHSRWLGCKTIFLTFVQ